MGFLKEGLIKINKYVDFLSLQALLHILLDSVAVGGLFVFHVDQKVHVVVDVVLQVDVSVPSS